MKPNFVEKGAERYVRGKTEQFDEKHNADEFWEN
jgi:hypothetical protein